MKKTQHYYEVSLSLPATWRQHIYTYSSTERLSLGGVVVVPFGSSSKLGIVTQATEKPKFTAKNILQKTPFTLPKSSQKLLNWLIDYYPAAPGVHVQHLLPAFLKALQNEKEPTEQPVIRKDTPPLTKEQQTALNQITNAKAPRSTVLHGITGSGKTRLYAEIAKQELAKGKNVLFLYPEISLTTQLKKELSRYIDSNTIHAYHSKLRPAQQKQTWLHAHAAETPSVFIGPRSALFLPIKNIGAVIVDEAHDAAYKQDSGTRYNGIIVAGAVARNHNAKLILGSATPPIQATQHILSKGGQLVSMNTLAKDTAALRDFTLVDMTNKQNRSKSYLLSKHLTNDMQQSLKSGKQSLLFLNRRGTARSMLCENCSWHAECSNCDAPLTFHHDNFTLQCHICGYSRKPNISCPDCGSELSQRTPGVKAIESELTALFPGAKIARYDSDNLKKDSFSENYDDVVAGKVDIIIGTQLITKGLDLPLLETVGVLESDSALFLPDYTSQERAFQQLLQVSGRVGRGHSNGKVILQTYQPKNPIFDYVINNDWPAFYVHELDNRKLSGFPPFSYAAKFWTLKTTSAAAQKTMQKITESLTEYKNIIVFGPAPSFYEKSNGKFAWQIAVTSHSRKTLAEIAKNLPKDIVCDLDPVSLL